MVVFFLHMPTEQNFDPATTPEKIQQAKHKAALHLILMVFANTPKGQSIVIGGSDSWVSGFG